MAPRLIGHGHYFKGMFKYAVLPLLIVGVAVSLLAPFLQWFRPAEANEGMLEPPAPINGERPFGYLKQICEIGPRIAGSDANARQRKLVADHFTKAGGKVRERPFRARHPVTGERLSMVNLIGSWQPDRLRRVLIAAHYDTRPHPDEEVDPNRH